ncbi:ABC transporter substrate-binding protein [uncultured Microbacterium sp.]|uniref:ABC transporter substrate-binding protein n=1 Tax=uncultured Microbacterium sp. TaxID=191216 RepID=UPI0035CB90C0
MRMKRTLVACSVGITALLMAGCAGTAATSAGNDSDGSQTLSVSVWDYSQGQEFKALFTAFEKANPDITIKPVDIISANYEDKITTMLAGGDSVDVIGLKDLSDFAGYAAKQQLLNIDDVAEKLPSDNLPALSTYTVDGTAYGVPYRQDFGVLYYNKTLFKNAGLPDPTNLSWSDFAADAAKLTSGSGPDKVYGAYIHTWSSMVQSYAAAQTGNTFSTPDYGWMKDQYDLVLGMQKAGTAMDWATANSQQVDYQAIFESGKAAMVPMGTWLIGGLLADAKAGTTNVDWGIAPMPQLKSGTDITTAGGPTGFGINKNAKNVDAAKKFLAFAAGEEGAKAVAAAGVVPAYHSDAITKQYFSLDGMPQGELAEKAFNPDVIKLDGLTGPDAAAIGTVLDQEHQLIMTASVSVADGLAEMGSRVKAEVLNK